MLMLRDLVLWDGGGVVFKMTTMGYQGLDRWVHQARPPPQQTLASPGVCPLRSHKASDEPGCQREQIK